MSRKTKVLEITDSILALECIRDNESNRNPYSLYLVFPDYDRNGYPTRHRKCLASYGNMESIVCHIRDLYIAGFSSMSKAEVLAWHKEHFRKY